MISISVYSYSCRSTTVVMEQDDGDEEGYFLLMEYWHGDSLVAACKGKKRFVPVPQQEFHTLTGD